MLTHVDLFSGIGGFALAARWAGVETIAFAEIDSYASRVIERHFPGVRNYGDVRNVPAMDAWLLTGGFPCQPFSSAGKRQGKADDRHLWPEMVAAIKRIKPAWVLGENVAGIIGMELDNILADLESQGYTAQAFVIPACAVNALHQRNRVWICAHARHYNRGTKHQQQQEERSEVADRSGTAICNPASERLPNWSGGTLGQPSPLTEFERSDDMGNAALMFGNGSGNNGRSSGEGRGSVPEFGNASGPTNTNQREVERNFRGVAHGVSRRVDRLKCLGNAIVPQVAYELIRRMKDTQGVVTNSDVSSATTE